MTEEQIRKLKNYYHFNYEEKYDAITLVDKNILLSAGAGCGKTTALSERVLFQVLAQDLSVNDMLILTFTVKAAQEMRDRIKKVLIDTAKSPEFGDFDFLTGSNRQRLLSEAEKVDTAAISTFDSFAHSIVVKYASKLGLDPHFGNLDEDLEKEIFKDCIAQVMDEEYRNGLEDENSRIRKFFRDNYMLNPQKLNDWLLSMLKAENSFPTLFRMLANKSLEEIGTDEYWLNCYKEIGDGMVSDFKRYVEAIEPFADCEIPFHALDRTKYKNIDGFLKAVIKLINDSIDAYHKFLNSHPIKSTPVCEYRKAVRDLFEAIDGISLSGNKTLKEGKTLQPFETRWRSNSLISARGVNTINALKHLTEEYGNLFIYTNDEDYRTKNLESLKYAFEIYQKAKERLDAEKTKTGSLTFADVIQKCLYLLENDKSVRESERFRIKSIMVDEYQDSDDKQEKLLEILGTEENDWEAYNKNKNPETKSRLFSRHILFMVGDVKQSIYRFRNANPSLFQSKYYSFSRNSENSQNVLLTMTGNHRSTSNVINQVNALFNDAMTPDYGEVDYKGDIGQHISCSEDRNFSKGVCTLDCDSSLLYFNADQMKDACLKPYPNNKSALMSSIIADKICEIINTKQTISTSKGVTKDVQFKDFAVLVEEKSFCNNLTKALDIKKIPYKFAFDQEIGEDEPIVAGISLLNLAYLYHLYAEGETLNQNQTDSLYHSLASVDRSYFLDIPDIEVFEDQQYLHPNNAFFPADEKEAENGSKKLKKPYALCKLDEFFAKHDIDAMSPSALFAELSSSFGVLTSISRLKETERKLSAYNWLVSQIDSLSNMSFPLSKVIDILVSVQKGDKEGKQKINSIAESDSVTICTMHSSKGLQYPIVFIPLIEKTNDSNEKKDPGIFDPARGLYVKNISVLKPLKKSPKIMDIETQDTIPGFLVNKKKKDDNASEKVRLLYVALTRAVNHNYLIYFDDCNPSTPFDTTLTTYDVFHRVYLNQTGNFNAKKVDLDTDFIAGILSFKNEIDKDITPLLASDNKQIKVEFEEPIDTEKVFPKLNENYSKASEGATHIADFGDEMFGEKLHLEMQCLDWSSFPKRLPNLGFITVKKERSLISNFVNSEFIKELAQHSNINFYQEMDFADPVSGHKGQIDLAITFDDDYAYIVDYKTKNLDSPAYVRQLQNYRRNFSFLKGIPEKNIRCFLYSLIDCKFKEV